MLFLKHSPEIRKSGFDKLKANVLQKQGNIKSSPVFQRVTNIFSELSHSINFYSFHFGQIGVLMQKSCNYN